MIAALAGLSLMLAAAEPAVAVQAAQAESAPSASAAPPPGEAPPIEVTGKEIRTPGDPMEQVNAQSFAVVQKVDDVAIAPAARVYKGVLPGPLRDGLHNAFLNLDQPQIVVNSLLQLKVGRAAKGLARFALNSTVGLAGLIDVAKRKPFNLPYKHNGFENTFALYGIGSGPYLYLPLIGPTTLRDVIGVTMDRTMLSFVPGSPLAKPIPAIVVPTVRSLDYRVSYDDELRTLRRGAVDPYAATRAYYLAQRKWEIDELKGIKAPPPKPEDYAKVAPVAAEPAPPR